MMNWKQVQVGISLLFFLINLFGVIVDSKDNSKNGGGGFKKEDSPLSSSSHNSHVHSGKQSRSRDGKKGDQLGNCNINQHERDCSELNEECIQCELTDKCTYGQNITVPCTVKNHVECRGPRDFKRDMVCQYCYQTPQWQQICNAMKGCNSVGPPKNYYQANCTVSPRVLCLGSRWFSRNMPCKWLNGYKWSTAFMLSVTLGGFGADRFYLGRWQEGIGKLFSFGGLGVWTIIDIILIGVRYLGPADGSLYVD